MLMPITKEGAVPICYKVFRIWVDCIAAEETSVRMRFFCGTKQGALFHVTVRKMYGKAPGFA